MIHDARRSRSAFPCLVLFLGVSAGLAGCGGGDGGDEAPKSSATTENQSAAPLPTSPFTPPKTTPDPQPAPGTGSQPAPQTPVAGGPQPAPSTPAPAPTTPAPATPAPVTAGDATVSWTAPAENEDGSTVSDLAGFTIVYGPSAEELHDSVRVNNPSIDRYVLDQLPAGTYYFAVKAFTSSGAESTVSNIVQKVIR